MIMFWIIVSQRSSLELASLVTKAGASPQNLWSILYNIVASQVNTYSAQAIQECIEIIRGHP